jgi:hypothetical protein
MTIFSIKLNPYFNTAGMSFSDTCLPAGRLATLVVERRLPAVALATAGSLSEVGLPNSFSYCALRPA